MKTMINTSRRDRIGLAKRRRWHFDGEISLLPLSRIETVGMPTEPRTPLSAWISLIAQLLGQKQVGLAIQNQVLAFHQLGLSLACAGAPRCGYWHSRQGRQWAAPRRSNFSWKGPTSSWRRFTSFPAAMFPCPLPERDIAIVVASDSPECGAALAQMTQLAPRWPRPGGLNLPHLVFPISTATNCIACCQGSEGIDIPATNLRSAARNWSKLRDRT